MVEGRHTSSVPAAGPCGCLDLRRRDTRHEPERCKHFHMLFVIWQHLADRHRQLGISRLTESAMGLSDAGDTHDYAAIATPVTLAQVAKAWVRPDPRFAAVSWSRRRGKTLAT